jgi:translation elongation factor EF-1beta
MEINKDKLEKAISSKKKDKVEGPKLSKEAEIGFHQGALSTLAAERIELLRMVQNVEKIMQMHLKRLEEMGIKFEDKK